LGELSPIFSYLFSYILPNFEHRSIKSVFPSTIYTTIRCLRLRINRDLVVAATASSFHPPNPLTTVVASFTHRVITLFRAQINAIIPFDGPIAAAAPIESARESIRFPPTPYLSGFDAAGCESYDRNNTITRGLRTNFA